MFTQKATLEPEAALKSVQNIYETLTAIQTQAKKIQGSLTDVAEATNFKSLIDIAKAYDANVDTINELVLLNDEVVDTVKKYCDEVSELDGDNGGIL